VPASLAPTTVPAAEIIDNSVGETLSDEEFASVLDELITGDLTTEQITEVVTQLLETDITSDQATQLATNPDIIATLDGDAAEQIFEALDISEVTPEEAAAIVEAVQGASDEVRAAFESTVDVFGGQVDTYVPMGSSVPVKTRRVLIAAAVAAAPAVRRRSI
jgi:Glu-tRNA(Gln) amidotransferase subunit E-like FAD-binding protein